MCKSTKPFTGSFEYRIDYDVPSVIHPLVLLSVVDHAARVPLSKNKRVLGVLLGQDNGTSINVANRLVIS